MLATTCSLFASAAVTLIISPDFITKSLVNSSIDVFAATAFTLNILNTALAVSVIVTVKVLELPWSFDTIIELTIDTLNKEADGRR